MAKKKKITRKQLLKEPDEFLTFSAKLVQFITQYRYPLLIAVGAIILGTLAVSAIRLYHHKMERSAFSAFAAVKAEYQSVLARSGPSDAYKAVQENIEQLIAKHGHRSGGKFARLFYANMCFRTGQYNKAIELYKQVLADETHPFIRNQTLNNLGYAYEATRDLQTAGTYFEKVTQNTSSELRAEALFNLSRIYFALGNPEKGAAVLKDISQGHPESMYIDLATERAGT